jgi:methylmalonyl-CoA mutase cobalamin-binding domain/chain
MAIEAIFEAVLAFNPAQVAELVQNEVNSGSDLNEILERGLIAPMDVLGQKYESGVLFVPEMLIGAMTVKAGLNVIKPLLANGGNSRGTVVIGTVKGDQHDVGKNLVTMMLEGAGFNVVDIGVDKGPNDFLRSVEENEADIVALSSLLTTSMASMQKIVAEVKKKAPSTRVMVGGAPISQDFANRIGADGYGQNGTSAVERARSFLAQ